MGRPGDTRGSGRDAVSIQSQDSLDALRNFNPGTGPSAQPDRRTTGTSVFDPVLTEVLLGWFAPAGGRILDPFAGGSVRGIVSATLGYHYTGIDLSAAQIAADERNGRTSAPSCHPTAQHQPGCTATAWTRQT